MRLAAGLLALLLALPAQAATLRFCAEGSPAGFDPSQTDSGVDFQATEQVFGTLIERERGTGRHIPGLAESWSVGADGRSYTFQLRRGVKFHTTPWFKPTRDFNADDVLFTFQRMLDPQHPFQRAYPSIAPYMSYMGWDKSVEMIEKLDEHTLRVRLRQPDAAFLSSLVVSFAGIHSAEYAAQLLKESRPQQIKQLPVGTGPFVFKSYQKDSVVRFVRNPDYWRPEVARVENLVFAITPDSIVRAQRLRKNECDIGALASRADALELAKDPAIRLVRTAGLNIGYLAFNTKKPPLNQLAVRQALDLAIDKKAIVDTVYGGAGRLANSVLPAELWAHDATIKPSVHDPARARDLLKQAGLSDLKLTLWAMPVQRAYNPNAQLMAQMIQADWAKVGVTARIVSYEWGEYLKRMDAGEHEAALTGWNADAEPAGTAAQLSCGSLGGSFWCDKGYEQAIQKARSTLDPAQRKAFYSQAQRIAAEQLPFSVIAYGELVVPLRQNVVDFRLDAEGNMRFDGVTLR
ncbi:ABC transporter substrate-binding protein [Roseateles violae]|uniref:ABC transporter substrate-binding protein n=1 Tax=Roseateles violae TaxID=3058042 RepID=A0ABT8DZT2_9BURK|nr:ABC transporter substrate-binding protein [Pelomonas sp. PFR6]MDN3923100.1 ABC transporter substrate-binding protein [Pelomonas sp. PFR6]